MGRVQALGVVLLGVGLGLLLGLFPAAAETGGLAVCAQGSRPVLGGGYNDVLRFWAEAGIRCGVDTRGSITLGFRYAESRANVLPWISLSYAWPLREGPSLMLAAGVRERLGDWEGDRLPEATLRFSLPSGTALGGWFDVGAGLFNVYGAQSGVLRAARGTGTRSSRGRLNWTYPALVDRVTLTDSGFADHLLSNSSGDRYPRAECRRLRL